MSYQYERHGALKYAYICALRCTICVGGVLILFSLASLTAYAQAGVVLDIDAGPASHTLNEYARQAEVELGFPRDDIRNIHTNPIKGQYTADEALERMLRGTGLTYYKQNNTFTIVVAESNSQPRDRRETGAKRERPSPAKPQPPPADTRRREEHALPRGAPVVEEILVTGSRIRGADGASPVVTITRQEIDRAGFATVEEVVEYLPQNFGGGASQDIARDGRASHTVVGGAVGSITAGTSVNLRGLGTSSTLVLLNGRRISASGSDARYVDISSIPLSAVDRVEVLTDGASAIYGSDAIAGVVNFILRDEYDGQETRLRYASDSAGDTYEMLLGQAVGRSWRTGRVLFSYEYYKHSNLSNVDRAVAASSDLSRFGGDDWRPAGGNPANIVAGGETFAIPPGQDGTALTPADFAGQAGVVNRHDIKPNEDFLPEQERHTAFVSLSQDVHDAEIFADLWFSTRRNEMFGDQGQRDLAVPSSNPFFVDPSDSGLDTVQVQGYSFQDDLGPFVNTGQTDRYAAIIGFSTNVTQSWQLEVAATYSKETAESTFENFVNRTALQAALAQSDPSLAFNPFGDGSHTNPSVIASMSATGNGSYARNTLWTANATLDGKAFEIDGRAVKLAAGVEFRREGINAHSIQGHEFGDPRVVSGADRSRDIIAGYAEFLFPLFHDTDDHGVDLSLAGRYEEYSDFGDSLDPKVGLVWTVTDSLLIRGTYGTSFKAPGLSDLDTTDLQNDVFFYYPLPIIPMETIFLLGGNEELTAETATTWTAGFELTPQSIDGLSISVTYFDIDFSDRVERPFGDIRQAFEPRFSTLVTLDPSADQIAEVIQDGRYRNIFGIPDADLLSGAAPVGAIVDGRINNLARSVVTGLELQANYAIDSEFGLFGISLNGNYLFDFERALVAADPLVDEVDTLGRPVDFRARAGLTWSHSSWTAAGYVNYTDGYTDNLSDPKRGIDPWTTIDLSVAYLWGAAEAPDRATRLSLSIQNALDEDPPFANSPGGLAYDSANANGRGRFVGLQIQKPW